MKKKFFLIFLLNSLLFCQNEEYERLRHSKLELIHKLKDLRSLADGKLISFLSDTDAVVRETATYAFGSIQDTVVLNLLIRNLNDPVVKVQSAAAFAIGQTGSMLSDRGRKILESELIWKKLGKTKVDEELIEEIGKFGTQEALDQLINRYAYPYPEKFLNGLIMSIARFAIRGIYNKDAIKYLNSLITSQNPVNWHIIYALMRISSIPESRKEILDIIPNISQLYKSNDPLVRMHLATLLGRLKDQNYGLEVLIKLAEFDCDWRVRINALKALSNFELKNNYEVINIFKRAFCDENNHIALTALNSFANTGVSENDTIPVIKETFDWLKRIAENKQNLYKWQYQANASITLARLTGSKYLDILVDNLDRNYCLNPSILEALVQIGSKDIVGLLFKYTEDKNPLSVISALKGIRYISSLYKNDSDVIEKSYSVIIKSVEDSNKAVVATAASILRDTIFLRKEYSKLLIKKLNSLRVPNETDAIQEIILTLEKLKAEEAIPTLEKLLQLPDRRVVLQAAQALQKITGKDYLQQLQIKIQPTHVDYDFNLLDLIKRNPIVRVETTKGEIMMELYPEVAPFTIVNFIRLAQKGYFRGTIFHRIVPNFVVQGGDPEGTGWGDPGYTIRSEFSRLSYETGSVGMASSGKDTEGSQFFITQSPQPHLDGRYTLFGKVIFGMDIVNLLQSDDQIYDIKMGF